MLRSQCQTAAARFLDPGRFLKLGDAARFFRNRQEWSWITASKKTPDGGSWFLKFDWGMTSSERRTVAVMRQAGGCQILHATARRPGGNRQFLNASGRRQGSLNVMGHCLPGTPVAVCEVNINPSRFITFLQYVHHGKSEHFIFLMNVILLCCCIVLNILSDLRINVIWTENMSVLFVCITLHINSVCLQITFIIL